MERLRADLWTFDVGAAFRDAADCAAQVVERALGSWDDGADLVVFPEFAWMALERFVAGPRKLEEVARLFWDELWPGMQWKLDRPDKAAVLGSAPFVADDGSLKNRAPIVCDGRFLHQDKIHLTPWETGISGGGPVRIWSFRGLRIATVICLDIEVPEVSAALRGARPDLLIVPSATENPLGVERVHRCASARAVELGCQVLVSQLVGTMESDWVDVNVGVCASYLPSQSAFLDVARQDAGELLHAGFHRKSVVIEPAAIRGARSLAGETNPSSLHAGSVAIEEMS